MNYTGYLQLRKPLENEFYSVQDCNFNADVIDAKLMELANQTRLVIASRDRGNKPDYGMDREVVLRASPFTGMAEITLQLEESLYDAENMTARPETAPSGTIIIKKVEE